MPLGFPAFPASAVENRLPSNPNHPYYKSQEYLRAKQQQFMKENPSYASSMYSDATPRSSISKEKTVHVEERYRDEPAKKDEGKK